MLLLLPSILCEEPTKGVSMASTPIGMLTAVLLIIDVVFLFYLLLTRTEELKARQTYIFLVHGTYFYLALNGYRLGTGLPSILLTVVILAVLYYFLCTIPLAVLIISVLNTAFLFSEIDAIFVKQVLGDGASIALGGSVGLIIAILLAIFYTDILFKIHNILVTYVYTAMLVTILGLVNLVSANQSATSNGIDVISAVVLLVVISVIVFMK